MKLYVIVANEPGKDMFGRELKYWNFAVGNGEWATCGSYYFSEEGAQEDIDGMKLNAHIEYDEI